jgi:hypothetical protein
MCQRYYYRIWPKDSSKAISFVRAQTATTGSAEGDFPVQMRTAPTVLEQSGTAGDYAIGINGFNRLLTAAPAYGSITTASRWTVATTVASGQTVDGVGSFITQNANAYLGWSAEL